MIIQCEQCNTKFRLDDSKVTDKGVKVRCAKCKHVFTVKAEQPESAPAADFGTMLDESASFGQEEETMAAESRQEENATPAPTTEPAFDPSVFGLEETSEATVSMAAASEPAAAEQPDSADNFDFSSLEKDQGFAIDQDETLSAPGEIDFGGFDFGDAPMEEDKTILASAPAPDTAEMTMVQFPSSAVAEDKDSDLDFGDEPLFGDAVATPEPEESAEEIKFDFQMDEFADSMGIDASAGKPANPEPFEAAPGPDEPFSLGEIDFGDELTSVAVQQVHPDELKPAQELLFGPLANTQESAPPDAKDTLKTAPAAEAPQAPQEELPPLSIVSRRKQNPLFTVLVAIAALAVVSALGYFGYSMFSDVKVKNVTDTGRITVRSVDASIVKNAVAGDLLVITGEAVNNFNKPRAAIQVKGMIYDGSGKVLASKNAYCGNPLTKEQLATMPLDKIESSMANQFGDSLANMGVEPGKAIPFVVVIAKPPAEAKDYGVEPAGSTVATGKQ